MDFQAMYQEVSASVKAYDDTVSQDLTSIKRWINMSQQYIAGKANWPFLYAHETVQTVADITTGTVSITAGDTTATFSSAPSVSVANWFIKFSSSDNWYRVSSHTAGASTAVLTQSYGESSSLSSGTYTLRKLFYATSTPLISILDIKETANGNSLGSVSARNADVFLPLYWDAGTPYMYISSVPTSAGALQFSLLYSPSSVLNLQVRGKIRLTDLSADSDTSIIPAEYHGAVIERALYHAFRSLDDTRSQEAKATAEEMIRDMQRVFSYDLGRVRYMSGPCEAAIDGPAYNLPSQYGSVMW